MSNHESEAIKQAQRRRAAWAKVEMARHPARPSPTDFIKGIFTEFSEIHGDRAFGDDLAVGCGMAKLGTEQVMVIFTRRGRSLKERTKSNFGMPSPEGYRKALRCMKIAEKFGRPILCIIDLLAAYPGPSSEERGQAEAIARNLVEMSRLRVPTISAIVGQGRIRRSARTRSGRPGTYAGQCGVFRGSARVCCQPDVERSRTETFGSGGVANLFI